MALCTEPPVPRMLTQELGPLSHQDFPFSCLADRASVQLRPGLRGSSHRSTLTPLPGWCLRARLAPRLPRSTSPGRLCRCLASPYPQSLALETTGSLTRLRLQKPSASLPPPLSWKP